MPTPQKEPPFVNWNQVAAFRLSQHCLVKRASVKSIASVAGDMAGVQAQLFSAAQIGLWSRVRGLQIRQIEAAQEKRALVKASCMRQTLFLVPSEELAIFVRGSAGRADKEIRWTLGKGVPQRTVDKAIEATLDVLHEPLTRPEIAGRVCEAIGVQTQAIHGGGWGSRRRVAAVPVGELIFPVYDLLRLVASRGVVCYGPYRGSEPTFVRADAWIPDWKDVPREQAEELLLRKYLHAFGPATASDFAGWSGITTREAQAVWARPQSGIVSVNVEGWTAAVLEEDINKLVRAKFKEPVVRLLPYFDTFLLGHKERNHLLAREHRPDVYRPQGWIAPVVLVNGRIAGVWEYIQEGDSLRVKVKKFEAISRSFAAGLQEEVQDLGRFLGSSDIALQVT